MYLTCPLCTSQRFFVEDGEDTIFLSITPDGKADDVLPKGAEVTLTPETKLFCSGCAWNGTLAELMADQPTE